MVVDSSQFSCETACTWRTVREARWLLVAEVQHELTYSEATPARQDEMATMGTEVPQWAKEEEFKV